MVASPCHHGLQAWVSRVGNKAQTSSLQAVMSGQWPKVHTVLSIVKAVSYKAHYWICVQVDLAVYM